MKKSELIKIIKEEIKALREGTDIGEWSGGGPKGDQKVLITQFVGPEDIQDLGRKCIQINVGGKYVQLNSADVIELYETLEDFTPSSAGQSVSSERTGLDRMFKGSTPSDMDF